MNKETKYMKEMQYTVYMQDRLQQQITDFGNCNQR
jgi:hypothetical protein